MLRLTKVMSAGSGVTLRVEGQIVAEWAACLDEECAALLREVRTILLDLADVTRIDARGVEVVNRLALEKVTVVNCSPHIQDCLSSEGLP